MKIKSTSVENTIDIGKKLASYLDKGDVILLDGDLGAGKTHFVKGLGEGFKVKNDITSPTFTILNQYKGENITLNHFDVYRVHDEEELQNIGFDEAIFSPAISVIEWSNLIPTLLPLEYIKIVISNIDETTREIDIDTTKSRLKERMMDLC